MTDGMEACVGFGKVFKSMRGADSRMPVQLTAELTRRCNFSCTHCYCRLPQDHPAASREMRGEEWERIFGEAAAEGAIFLVVTGGEPLLHPEFREIWMAGKRLGLIPDLYTNASLITAEMADFLAFWPPRRVSLTLYGATEATYRAVTAREGMLERVLEAAKLLRDRGLSVEIKGTITRENVHEFHGVREHPAREGQPFRWSAELIGPVEGSAGRPESVRLSGQEIVALEKSDPVRWAEWKGRLAAWQPSTESPGSPFRCKIGRSGVHVDPYGIMRACEFVESVAYDVRTGSLQEGWRRVLPEMLAKFPWSSGPCQTCDLADVCRNCPGHALVEGQPASSPTVMHCDLGKARAESFGLSALLPRVNS